MFTTKTSYIIAAVLLEVCRVDIDDDLVEQGGILSQTSGGDHSLDLEPPEDLSVSLIARIPEVDTFFKRYF